jgi:hypothetical protein
MDRVETLLRESSEVGVARSPTWTNDFCRVSLFYLLLTARQADVSFVRSIATLFARRCRGFRVSSGSHHPKCEDRSRATLGALSIQLCDGPS